MSRRTLTGVVVGVVLLGLLAAVWWASGHRSAPAPATTATHATTVGKATATGRATGATRPATTVASPKTSGRQTPPGGRDRDDTDPASGLPFVDVAALPPQARDTLALIDKGGPFPYPGKDGSTYRNLNKVLPQRADGYYREYTVPTPGESDRGARRIVVGRDGELYWTADHYDTFARIRR